MSHDEEEKSLRSVALQNVLSITNARRRAEEELLRTKGALEEETRVLEVLNQTGTTLASKLDLESIVQAVTDAGTSVSGAEFGAFFYTAVNADGGIFKLFALSGAPREAFEKFGHPRATPVFAPTFAGAGIIRLADVTTDPRYGKWGPHHGMPKNHLPVRSYLAVPVISRSGEVLGGLFFGHSKPDIFTERAERMVTGIAAQAAIAIDNAKLFEDSRRLAEAERAARVEAERTSILKDEFLATVSHELRTPLNAILGWAGILKARVQNDDDTRRAVDTIERNARAQAQLIEDLLDMNRIVSGKVRLDVQRADLAQIVEAALDSIRPSADAKSITIRQTIDPNAGPVHGDPNRLQQIVWNLLSNAVKFTPKGGKIDVLIQRVNSHIEITVHDTGIGIRPEFLPHVFDRFRQDDSSTTRKFGGLGLGLSIVKQLVELHGGTVAVQSAGENQGSTFLVCLPLRTFEDARPEDRSHPRTSTSPGLPYTAEFSLEGIDVLVVDDELDARTLVHAVLVNAGATVRMAGSAEEALHLLASAPPHVLVSDIGMPQCDGYQLMRRVRGLKPEQGGKTPAIALTAFARSEDRTRAMLAGYQVHVSKPIEAPELIAAVKNLAATVHRPGD